VSAYMCSERELTLLATYAVKHCLDAVPYRLRTLLERDGFERRTGDFERTVGNVFAMLTAANLASLSHRYPGDTIEHAATSDSYCPVFVRLSDYPPLTVIKLCHHYAYQACEHDGWKDSDARKLVDTIESHAVHNLPGYDAAPWGIE